MLAGEGVRKKNTFRKRQREPVREPEVRVGFGERGRDAHRGGGDHDRPGDEAARSEDDVGAAPAQDRSADGRRGARQHERAQQSGRRLPRDAFDAEGVELVARVRNEPSLDAIRRPGERHEHVSLRQRFRHRERGQDVPRRPAGRDHAPKLPSRCHVPRC